MATRGEKRDNSDLSIRTAMGKATFTHLGMFPLPCLVCLRDCESGYLFDSGQMVCASCAKAWRVGTGPDHKKAVRILGEYN